jgi:hypothetical protein
MLAAILAVILAAMLSATLAAMLAAMLADLLIEVEASRLCVDTSTRRQLIEMAVRTAVRPERGALTDRVGLTRGPPESPLSLLLRWHQSRRILPRGLRSTRSALASSRVTGQK